MKSFFFVTHEVFRDFESTKKILWLLLWYVKIFCKNNCKNDYKNDYKNDCKNDYSNISKILWMLIEKTEMRWWKIVEKMWSNRMLWSSLWKCFRKIVILIFDQNQKHRERWLLEYLNISKIWWKMIEKAEMRRWKIIEKAEMRRWKIVEKVEMRWRKIIEKNEINWWKIIEKDEIS